MIGTVGEIQDYQTSQYLSRQILPSPVLPLNYEINVIVLCNWEASVIVFAVNRETHICKNLFNHPISYAKVYC